MSENYQFPRRARLRRQFAEGQARNIARQRAQAAIVKGAALDRPPSFCQAFSTEELLITARHLQSAGPETSPGVDGVTFAELSPPELAGICRELSAAVLGGNFTPSGKRTIRRPKRSGGFREISIRSIAFRIVARRLHESLGAFLDQFLSPVCVGGRPGRDVRDVLAALTMAVEAGNHVMAVNDVLGAFDHVVHVHAMEDIHEQVRESRYLELVERILAGHPSERRVVGLDQGGAFSTDGLNWHLHRRLDLILVQAFPSLFLRRFVDDIVYSVDSIEHSRAVRGAIAGALGAVGLKLKPDCGAVDLREGGICRLLGFDVRLVGGGVCFEIPNNAWDHLGEQFDQAWQSEAPLMCARGIALAWVHAYGPAMVGVNWDDVADRVVRCAGERAFNEIDRRELRRAAQCAADRWTAFMAQTSALGA